MDGRHRHEITDDCLKEMDKTAGAVLLEFSAAFDIIDPNLLLRNTYDMAI